MEEHRKQDHRARIMRLIMSGWLAPMAGAAVSLHIADVLAEGPRSVEEIAEEVHVDCDKLYRLLRALADGELGEDRLFEEVQPRSCALAPLAEALLDRPGSMRDYVVIHSARFERDCWSYLPNAVRSGKTGVVEAHGMSAWEWLKAHPADAETFDRAMMAVGGLLIQSVVESYDWGQHPIVVDVGGGRGHLLATILDRYPAVHGILFDRSEVIAGAKATLARHEEMGRCQRQGGDFFVSVPAGGDAYLISNVVHNWPDTEVETILRGCRAAMGSRSKVLVAEHVLADDPRTPDLFGKFLDLYMSLTTGGCQRTESEFARLGKHAGLTLSARYDFGRFSLLQFTPGD